jgi:hypothetical protein
LVVRRADVPPVQRLGRPDVGPRLEAPAEADPDADVGDDLRDDLDGPVPLIEKLGVKVEIRGKTWFQPVRT